MEGLFSLDHPSPTLVSHPCLYLSARPISHSFWRSVSCGDPDSTIRGLCPHKWGQDVSCGYLIRRWQLILELLLHYTPMADSLHLCFPLGHSVRLPLVVCHFLFSWSRFVENWIVLGNVSYQFGPSSFVLGHFSLLGVGLGLDMKWAGVAKFFGPTISINLIISTLMTFNIYIKIPYSYQPRALSLSFLFFYFLYVTLCWINSFFFFFSFFILFIWPFFNSNFYGIKTNTLIRYL